MYKGRLFYEGEDNYIEVHRFVKREEDGAIELTTTWGAEGKFMLDARLKRTGDTFTTGKVNLKNEVGVTQNLESEIEFTITDEFRDEGEISINGIWREAGEEYKFEGDLAIEA